MITITTDNFDKTVADNKLVFIDFYADWCGPCKMMAPIVEELEKDYEGRIVFAKCNIDDNMPLAQRFRVMSIPTFKIFENGEAVETVIGGTSKSDLAAIIDAQL